MFTPKIRYDKKSSIETNVRAVINMVNFLLKEMTAGRVITSQKDIIETQESVSANNQLIADYSSDLLYEICLLQLGITDDEV